MGRARRRRPRQAAARPADETRTQRQPSPAWYRRLPTGIQMASGVVGLLTATLGLVFLVLPNLRPDPVPPRSATLTATLGSPLAQGDYLRLTRRPSDGLSPSQLALVGHVVDVEGRLAGEREVLLRWVLLDAATGVPKAESERQTLELDEAGEDFSWPLFVLVPEEGRYKVLVELYPEEAERRPGVARIKAATTDEFTWPAG